VDQDINNNQNETLWTLLAYPANDAHLYASNLRALRLFTTKAALFSKKSTLMVFILAGMEAPLRLSL